MAERLHSVVLIPTSSKAPTFYNSGGQDRYMLGGSMRREDADKVKSWFDKTPYTRDYISVVREQSTHYVSGKAETEMADFEHKNLKSRYEIRLKALGNMYSKEEQPTGGSTSNSVA